MWREHMRLWIEGGKSKVGAEVMLFFSMKWTEINKLTQTALKNYLE